MANLSPFFPLPTRPSGVWDEATTGRWLDNLRGRVIKEVIRVGDKDAAGDGVTNDANAIQSAIDAAALVGTANAPAVVKFAYGGRYLVGATTLNIKSYVILDVTGASIVSTTDSNIIANSATAEYFGILGGTYIGVGTSSNSKAAIRLGGASGTSIPVSNFFVRGVTIKDIDWGVFVNDGHYFIIEDYQFIGVNSTNGDACLVCGSNYGIIRSCRGKDFKKNLVYVSKSTGDVQNEYFIIDGVTGNGLAGSTLSTGIAVRNLRRSTISNVTINGTANGGLFIQTEASDTVVVGDVEINNLYVYDAEARAIYINGTLRASSVYRLSLNNIRTEVSGTDNAVAAVLIADVQGGNCNNLSIYDAQGTNGLDLTGGVNDWVFTNTVLENIDEHGIRIGATSGCVGVTFSGVSVKDASQTTNNTYHDIQILHANTVGIVVDGFNLRATAANKSARGIYADTGTTDVVVGSGYATGHVTKAVDNRSTRTVATWNSDWDVYTPTRSAEANLDANVTPSEAQYMRVGNIVTVSGRFTADPTLTATATSFELTLPVASNIGAVEDAAGVAFCGAIAGMGAAITGSVANNTAVFTWVASDITSQAWSYTYSYQIL